MKLKKINILTALTAVMFMASALPAYALTYDEIVNQGKVLGDSTYVTGSLVKDGATIYFISGYTKIPFANWQAFLGLGYQKKNIVSGSLANYSQSDYVIKTSRAAHPWGGWLSYKGVVYYSSQQGLIAVPSSTIFISNGGTWANVVKVNNYDIAALRSSHNLSPLSLNDPRVVRQLSFSNGSTSPSASSPASSAVTPAPAAPNPNLLSVSLNTSFGGGYYQALATTTSLEIGSFLITAPTSQSATVTSITLTPAGLNLQSLSLVVGGQPNGSGPVTVTNNAPTTITLSTPAVIPAGGNIEVDVYANILNALAAQAPNPVSVSGVTTTGTLNFNGNVAGQQTAIYSSSAPLVPVTASLNSAFKGGSIADNLTSQKIGSYVLTASSAQDAKLNSLNVELQPGGGSVAFQNLSLQVNGAQYGQMQSLATPAYPYTFTGGSLTIPANGSVTVDVYATPIQSIAADSSSFTPATALSGCVATGVIDGTVANCSFISGQNISIFESTSIVPNVTLFSPRISLQNGNEILANVTVTAHDGQDITLQTLPITVTATGGASASTTINNIIVVDYASQATVPTINTSFGISAGSQSASTITLAGDNSIAANTWKTYSIEVPIIGNLGNSGASTITFQLGGYSTFTINSNGVTSSVKNPLDRITISN